MPLADLKDWTHILGDLIIMETPSIVVNHQRRHCYDLITIEVSPADATAVVEASAKAEAPLLALLERANQIPATHIFSIEAKLERVQGEMVGRLSFRGLSLRNESEISTDKYTKKQKQARPVDDKIDPRVEQEQVKKHVFKSLGSLGKKRKKAKDDGPSYKGKIDRPAMPKRPNE